MLVRGAASCAMPRLQQSKLPSFAPLLQQTEDTHNCGKSGAVPAAAATSLGPLRVWAAGSGAPTVLLVPPLRPGPRGHWQMWEPVGLSLLHMHSQTTHGGSTAVWIAEWSGFARRLERSEEGTTIRLASKQAHVTALAEAISQALVGGRLQLVVGVEGSGLLVLQALRALHLKADVATSVVVLAPHAWAAPLLLQVGEDYPARLLRRQLLGNKLQQACSALGLDSVFARWLVPESSAEAEPRLVVSWWLGLLDPVSTLDDAVRELLLSGRAVDETQAAALYQTLRSAAAEREAASDDADDDDFAVGALSSRSKRPRYED